MSNRPSKPSDFPPDASRVTWSTQTLRTPLSMPMASPPLDVGEPDFLTFLTVTFWMTMLLDSRMWMPSWSKRAPAPTPTMVTLLICLSSITPSAVLQLSPDTLLVLPWSMVPSTSMVSGVSLSARPQRAAWISVPVVARTVWPPAPPVVPPFCVAYPVAPPAAADAAGISRTAPVPAATAIVAITADRRRATGRLILVSLRLRAPALGAPSRSRRRRHGSCRPPGVSLRRAEPAIARWDSPSSRTASSPATACRRSRQRP